MPSFRTLPDNEIEALVEYVRYLSLRGETEVRLIEYLASEGEMPGSITEIAGGFPLSVDDEGIPEEEPDEVDAWHTLLRARAIEAQSYVIAAAQGGTHNAKRESYGHALVVDPWGNSVAETGEVSASEGGLAHCVSEILSVGLSSSSSDVPEIMSLVAGGHG